MNNSNKISAMQFFENDTTNGPELEPAFRTDFQIQIGKISYGSRRPMSQSEIEAIGEFLRSAISDTIQNELASFNPSNDEKELDGIWVYSYTEDITYNTTETNLPVRRYQIQKD